jgi:hypothetical protein
VHPTAVVVLPCDEHVIVPLFDSEQSIHASHELNIAANYNGGYGAIDGAGMLVHRLRDMKPHAPIDVQPYYDASEAAVLRMDPFKHLR